MRRSRNRRRAEIALEKMRKVVEGLRQPVQSYDDMLSETIEVMKCTSVEGCEISQAFRLLPEEMPADTLRSCNIPGAVDADTGAKTLVYKPQEFDRLVRANVVEALRDGSLTATYFNHQDKIDAPDVSIPAARWHSLVVDWDTNTIKHAGRELSGLVVYSSPQSQARKRRSPGKVCQAASDAAYRQRVEDCEQRGERPSEKDDIAAMRAQLGDGITRDVVRRLRAAHAPNWRRPGRRKLG